MFPKLTIQPEGSSERQEVQDLQIDPQFLSRYECKQMLPQANSTMKTWPLFDGGTAVPPFFDENWTLGETARWVIGRRLEAVNGVSIDERELFEILPEIESAFLAGEVSIFSTTENDPIPRELPAETWSLFKLVIEPKNGLIRILALNPSNWMQLLNVRVKRKDVLKRWPDPASVAIPVRSSGGAENRCRQWLVAMMKANPNNPRPKAIVRADALAKFLGLSGRAFDRAWDKAIDEAAAPKWRASGRRRS